MSSEGLQVTGLVLQILGTVVTAVLTVMIYRLTHFVARGESVRAVNEGWADYDLAMIQDDNIEVFNAFLRGSGDYTKDYSEKKEHFLVYLLLNSLSNEYYSARSGVLSNIFADDSIDDYLELLWPRWRYIVPLMETRGYDRDFIKFVRTRFERLEKEHARENRSAPSGQLASIGTP